MATVNPVTNLPLPDSAIQRVLYIAPRVHVYQIPPLSSTKGHAAANWTHPTAPTARQIFTARLRILEVSVPNDSPATTPTPSETVTTTILLEDPSSGQLFAAAPYTSPPTVEQAVDSSRFFALRVADPSGRTATLGVGFEERGEAIDFGIALQDARRALGWEKAPAAAGGLGGHRAASGGARKNADEGDDTAARRDFSLKEGEVITVDIGGRGKGRRTAAAASGGDGATDGDAALFSIKPPPGAGGGGGGGGGAGIPFLPPPPSASEVKAERRRSRQAFPEPPVVTAQQGQGQGQQGRARQQTAQELGFDDGEFGEFQ